MSTFWHLLQKSTKWRPGGSIWALSGLCFRSRQNDVQEARFEHFLAFAPEVDKMTSRRLDLSTFCHWLQKSTKWRSAASIWTLSGLAPEVDKMTSRRLDLSTFRPLLQKSTKWRPGGSIWALSGVCSRSRQNDVQEARFEHFLSLAPEVDKMTFSRLDLNTFWPCSRSRQNDVQEARFEHFLALASEVDKMTPRMLDLSTFWHLLQKSTKWRAGGSIWSFSGLGFRSRQNDAQEATFEQLTDCRVCEWPRPKGKMRVFLTRGKGYNRKNAEFQSKSMHFTMYF